MNSPRKKMLTNINYADFIELVNEKLVYAARDLAEFTKKGIYAHHIVDLAQKCEDFENHISQPFQARAKASFQGLRQDLFDAVMDICDMGREIWPSSHPKYKDYVISLKQLNINPYSSPSTHVA